MTARRRSMLMDLSRRGLRLQPSSSFVVIGGARRQPRAAARMSLAMARAWPGPPRRVSHTYARVRVLRVGCLRIARAQHVQGGARIPLSTSRRFARKARAYRRAYREGVDNALTCIESMVKTFKTHRNAIDFAFKFITDAPGVRRGA